MTKWLLAMVVAVLAACAGTPDPGAESPPAGVVALDPTGTFDFSTVVDGSPVTGTITITRVATGLGGTITSTVTDTLTIRTVSVEGSRVLVTADTPDGPLSLNMDFAGDEFTGTWALGELSGTHSGRRRTG
ncbi:MAG TPA: hypothetical protein VK939_05135 [Longimicrobiales bacterium]|nr:hypothetical protein [Longimicrobiales bacterium]